MVATAKVGLGTMPVKAMPRSRRLSAKLSIPSGPRRHIADTTGVRVMRRDCKFYLGQAAEVEALAATIP